MVPCELTDNFLIANSASDLVNALGDVIEEKLQGKTLQSVHLKRKIDVIWPKLKIRGYIKRDNSCGITLLKAVQFVSESISVISKFLIPNP